MWWTHANSTMMRLPCDNPWNADVVTLWSVNKNARKNGVRFFFRSISYRANPIIDEREEGKGRDRGKKRNGEREASEKWIPKRARKRKDETKNIENKGGEGEREREKGKSVSEDSWTP